MNWKNAAFEKPADRQDVLISVNGIYYHAVYHETINTYLSKIPLSLKFTPNYFTIYWCQVIPPGVKKEK